MRTFTFNINLYDLAFLGIIFLGLGMFALLWFAGRQSKVTNRFLAPALLIIVLYAVKLLAIDTGSSVCPLQFLLGVGPLIFFYVRKVTRPQVTFKPKDILHFLPLLFEIGLQLLYIKIELVLQSAAMLSVIGYLLASHQLIQSFYQRMKFINGDRYRHEMRWLHGLIVSFSVLVLSLLLVRVIDYTFYNSQLPIYTYYPFYIAFGILMIWTACVAFLRPGHGIAPVVRPYLNLTVASGLKQKGNRLKREIKINRYYEDPELSMPLLAEKLGLHPNELSKIINTVFKKSFNDLINEYRIAEVSRKMQNAAYNHLTLLGIAYESGFNSKTTFNRTFKQFTGKSPAEYKNELKKERPNYNMERSAHLGTVLSYHKPATLWANMKPNRSIMLKNYFKIAWRSLMRNKSYTTINVTGLAIGVAACLLIFLVVQYETGFDTYHTNKDRIYRVLRSFNGPDGVHTGSGTPLPLTEGIKLDMPQVKLVGNIFRNGGSHYTIEGLNGGPVKKFKEDYAYYADPEFFKIFDIKWLAGNKNTALTEPNQVILSRSEANKFFGNWRKAMGKLVKYENRSNLVVTGIFEDTPINTDIPIRLAVSWVTFVGPAGDLHGNANDWISTFGDRSIYVVLPKDMPAHEFNRQLALLTKKHIPSVASKKDSYKLQPLKDIHFDTEAGVYSGHAFSRELIGVISLIGLFLLIIACVNFVNLATAQAVNRSKEVGVRKVLGSNRYQLMLQFITETLIITLFAVALAVVIALVTLPMLNDLLEVHLNSGFIYNPKVVLFLVALVTGVTLLAGLYPALVLSGFNPITALRNQINAGKASGISLRRVLVVAQFCIAQFLVIGTLVLVYQMNYFKTKSLGFSKDAAVIVPTPTDSISRTKSNVFKDELLKLPGVKGVSSSQYTPSDGSGWFSDFKFDHSDRSVDFSACLKWIDVDFFKLYNIRFVAGGPYTQTDTISGYVINETLMHKLGITDPKLAIGKNIMLWDNKKLSANITGVVKDYNAGSLRNAIPPVLMGPWKEHYSMANVKVDLRNAKQTLVAIENLWNKIYPDGLYEYRFLDQSIAEFYKNEEQLSTLYKIFAGIAIFISCLGLYGLVSFMAVQRTKEVGIRKTLGASVGHIVYLFSKEFTILIIIAFAISAPLGYYFMTQWLQDYTYRIDLGPGVFILAIVVSIAIAWTSVGYKAIKAALANPVKSLKSE